MLYAQAETQNVRRRAEKEIADAHAYSATKFARDILSVSDNMSRALAAIPADAVTTSGSGLDPDVSPAYARLQAARIARARGVPVQQVQSIIDAHIEGAFLGFIGQPHVNVLLTNRALDARFGAEG